MLTIIAREDECPRCHGKSVYCGPGCDVCGNRGFVEREVPELLAAAKELAAADACNYDRDVMRNSGRFGNLRAAIAKAEGRA